MIRPVMAIMAALAIMPPVMAAPARSLHDIPWYEGHTAARGATIKLCRSDNAYSHDVDCLNAETAENRVYARQMNQSRGKTPAQYVLDPQYWADNRLGRLGAMASCEKYPGLVHDAAVCNAIARGDALDKGRR